MFSDSPPLQTPFGSVTQPQPWPQGRAQANDPRGLSSWWDFRSTATAALPRTSAADWLTLLCDLRADTSELVGAVFVVVVVVVVMWIEKERKVLIQWKQRSCFVSKRRTGIPALQVGNAAFPGYPIGFHVINGTHVRHSPNTELVPVQEVPARNVKQSVH